jgi:hypothetical protein
MAKGKKTPATGAQTPATPRTGAQTPAVQEKEEPKTAAVVGINFGNTYASIAVITKVRHHLQRDYYDLRRLGRSGGMYRE